MKVSLMKLFTRQGVNVGVLANIKHQQECGFNVATLCVNAIVRNVLYL